MKSIPKSFVDRFLSRIDMSSGPDGCWPLRTKQSSGYPRVGWIDRGDRVTDTAHRVSFFIHNGWVPMGRTENSGVVRHVCDNPRCCNPKHLVSGSQRQNVHDAISRGRHVPPPHKLGELHGNAVLTAKNVASIRNMIARGNTIAEIARNFGVGETTIRHIRDGKTWAA